MRITHWTTLAAGLVLIQAACTVDKADQESRRGTREAYAQAPAAAPNLVTVTAREFAFGAPATISAGLTTVRLVNEGKEMHHVQLIRLDAGHTVAELMELAKTAGEPIPAWAKFVGGPNVHAPGAHSEATMVLEPGEYALVCFIPSADGVPHIAKGMVKPLTVVPATPNSVVGTADVTMTLRDYAFETTPEITAGKRTVEVVNAAAQPHEVVLMRLEPGKTPQDLLAWVQTQQGPPPALPMGGTSFLSQGERNQITADFTPGEYVLLCFVPDAGDGRPHVAHGLVRQFTVR
jgi:plastocyanin